MIEGRSNRKVKAPKAAPGARIARPAEDDPLVELEENNSDTGLAVPGAHVVCAPISPSKVPPAPVSESHRARIVRQAVETEGYKVVNIVKLSANAPTSFLTINLSQSNPTPRPDGLEHTELTIKRRLRQCLRAVGVEVDDDLMHFGDRLTIPFSDKNYPLEGNDPTLAIEAKDPNIELGEWAEERLQEAKKFANLVWSGSSPETLRGHFPKLFEEVIDRLTDGMRKNLFDEVRGRRVTVPTLMDYIADVKSLSGSRLNDYLKLFRKARKTPRPKNP
jgi:hypothetical protein